MKQPRLIFTLGSHILHMEFLLIMLAVRLCLCAGAGFVCKIEIAQWEESFRTKQHFENKTDSEE